ncbi:anaerobic ribonucleoside-triphosphate reductase activating protein [Treponema rectale]|uniref:Anaerobic ribonucleoside-triphosphate reductase-activating protein n=1 Tax=Treponema rectale TaxID=744512 RepID=A0A840SHY1_9SPIR|nr:anaerobic ribonucleoside-triphosphate reductase activating protein [Treponema rectale]MBB5219021.1 anaerobic ribonucleoside-triphosphate reductase activating protein [Treponema rectale]QOS41067.1 anaerobic ribonucleoside-triphosphate reductase activating protein [Treponema rectale]
MNYGEIKTTDIANGEGVRVTLFVSGCRIHCKGCFNSQTWDFNYGKPFTFETEEFILKALAPEYIAGFTVLGGEPMEPENQRVLVKLLRRIKETYPSKTIWCYSGYIYDKDLLPANGKKHCEVTDELLSYINVLVDGPFILKEKDISLQFRGSRNQRILKLK